MKRKIILSLVLFISLLLAACGSEEENSATLRMEEEGLIVELTYLAEGDKVIEQRADNIITYEAMGISSAEEAEELLGDVAAQYEAVDGITYEMDYQDDQAIETLTIDFENVDLEEVNSLPGAMFEGEDGDYISFEQSIEYMEESGFELIEQN